MHFWIVLPCCIHHVRYICISELCYLVVFNMWGIYAFLNCVTLLYSSCKVYMHFWIVLPCCIHHVRYICICIYTSCISVLSRFLICHTLVWTITELCHTSLSTIYWHVFRCCLLSLIFRVINLYWLGLRQQHAVASS